MEGMLAVKQMPQRGVQEQAVRHNDQTVTHSELIVCQGLSAAVTLVQKDVTAKEYSSSLVCYKSSQCQLAFSYPNRENCQIRILL